MPIRSIDELRNWAGPDWKSASDEDLISMYSRAAKVPPTEVAMTLGYDPGSGGVSAKQLSSSVDRYQAGLYGVGEAVTGAIGLNKASGWLAEQRRANELQADVASARAREMGAVDTWKDVKDVGDFGSYAKSLAIQSLPYAGEAVVGGLAARGLMSGTRAALTGAKTVEEAAAAKRALDIGSTAGGVAASYPSAVGDILSNQREQSGKTDLLAAGGLAIPYAGLNALGVDSALMRGGVFRNTINLLDRPGGLLGAATRTVATGTGVALKEGISETGQEVLNQAGRMAVDPNATLTDPEAIERYKESFAGGATLGGIMGGGLGGWRRSTPATNEIQQAFSQPEVSSTPINNVAPPAAPLVITPANHPNPTARLAELEAVGKGSPARTVEGPDGQPIKIPATEGRFFTPEEQQEYKALKAQAATLTPPAVTGGTTDIAQQTQAAAAENQQVQEAQQNLAKREEVFGKVATLYDPENPTSLNIFGQNIEGPRVETFGNRFATVFNTLPPHVQTLAQAITQANKAFATPEKPSPLVSFSFNANNPVTSAEKALEALGKVMTKFQIDHVQSLDEAVQILNKLSTTTKGNQLEQLNAIYEAITGQDTDGFTAAQATKAEKGAKDGKLQTTTGLGAVSVEGGAGQANDGNDENVQSSNVQSVGTGSLPAGSLGLQTGQQAGEGIRTGTGADTSVVDGNASTQVIGATNEQASQSALGGGEASGQSQQAGAANLDQQSVQDGSRTYDPRITFYATDLSHISSERRIEVISELLLKVLAPKQERKNTVPAATRAEILRLALLEQFRHADIASYTGLKTDTVEKQLERMGVKLVDGEFQVIDPEFAARIVATATSYRSPEFPDGIGQGELSGLYNTRYEGEEQSAASLAEELEAGEQEGKPGAKLQEELGGKEDAEGQTMGTVSTAGGSQGAVDSEAAAFFDKVEKLQTELEALPPKDPRRAAKAEQLQKLWADYAKSQEKRRAKGEAVVEEGDENAVQESSTEEVPVQKRTGGGKKVGKGNAQGGKAAGKAEVKQETKPEEIKTPAEEWANLSKLAPELPPYDVLTNSEKTRWDDLVRRGQANLAAAVKIVGEVTQPTGTALANQGPQATGATGTTQALVPWAGVKRTTKGDVEMVPTASLDGVAQRNKADTSTPEYAALKASIQATGIVDPITITTNSLGKAEVFEGNHRLQAARELGLTEVPVVLHDRVTPSESQPLVGRKPSSILPAVTPKFGSDQAVVKNPYTAAELTTEIQNFIRADIFDRKLVIVDSIEDLLNSRLDDLRALAKAISDKGAYGVAADGTAYLIANRISKGEGRAKFMHEVGAHLGLENLLPTAVYDKLVDQLETWAAANDGSLESKLANKARERVGYAATPTVDQRNELLAYFVEEAMLAGVDPTATAKESGPLYAWFRTLWAAFKVAVRRLGFKPEKLTAQDVVNMAYGAARLEMSGTWHGTAATYRKFNHNFMSTGEGAQAYGWGSYLAQAVGIGKGYWWNDVKRKETSTVENIIKQYVGWRFEESVLHPVDREEIAYAGSQIKVAKDLAEAVYMNPAEYATPGYLTRRLVEAGVDYIKLISPTGEKKTVRIAPPAGNLMRVDTAVSNSEMLDWDASFADQPKLVRDFVKGEAATIKAMNDNGASIRIKNGEDIYKYLILKFWVANNLNGSWKNATPEQRMEVKKQSSKYLEANGIQGIRFLDANSRTPTALDRSIVFDGKKYTRDALVAQSKNARALSIDEQIPFTIMRHLLRNTVAEFRQELTSKLERHKASFIESLTEAYKAANQAPVADIKERAQGAADRSYEAKLLAWLDANESKIKIVDGNQAPVTRNLVIFNEKNIQRVGSEVSANRERMKFGIAGQRSLNNLDPAEADRLKAQLVKAKLMAAAGNDADKTWTETGWFKGVDGKWKYEIPDTNAKFKPQKTNGIEGKVKVDEFYDLEDILDHPALFKAYPQLKDYKIMFDQDLSPSNASFNSLQGKITMSGQDWADMPTLLHELQHAIQHIEGFTRGGSPDSIADPYAYSSLIKFQAILEFKKQENAANGVKQIVEYLAAWDDDVNAAQLALATNTDPSRKATLQMDLDRNIDEYLTAAQNVLAHFKIREDIIRSYLYSGIAGEQEARLVEGRSKLSDTQLKNTLPKLQFDERATLFTDKTGMSMKFGVTPPATVDRAISVLPKPLQKSTRGIVTNLLHQAKRGLYASAITEDLAGMAKKYMPSVTKYLEAQYARQATRLTFEKRIENILAAYDKLPQNLQGEGKGSVNEYIHDSTREKKWGYYPGEQQIGTKLFQVDEDFKKRFDAFPAAAQQVIKDVFRHGHDALTLKQQAAENAVNREFEARIKAAANDADLLQQIAKEKKQMLKRITSIRNVSVGDPYAYLGRYGDYVVVAKSKEFIAYEEAAKGTQARVGADSITGDPQQAKNWLQENVANPMHYVVQFAETQNEADEIAAQLQATGQYDIQPEDAGIKEANASYVGGSDIHLAVARLRNMASRSESTDDKLDKAIADLYLMTVADASARASELQRKNVAGADKNMMRNLATSGRADAHFLATMEHSDEINDSLEAMRNEARNDRREAMPMYNELFIRHANSMNYQPVGDLATALTRMTTLWTLSTNPAFYLQQVLQTSVLSLPFMAGRLGYFRSARAIKRAYGDMSELVKGLGVNEHINFDKAPADVRNMLNTLVGMGKIDLGIDAEAKARTGEDGVLGKVMLKLQGVNTRIESINRATAAIAAYRGYLDRYKNGDTAAATKYAADVVSNTHGSYDGFNTPRIMSGDVGRVALQFKRFQIIQLSMLAKLIHTSFKGASADEKAVARASLKFIVAHMAVLGGALGVPFVSQAAWILSKVFGDEDEPDDYEYKLRRMIGDGPAADLLLRGVPAALGLESLGKKLSMENVASPFGPFVDPDITSRTGAEKMLIGVMGPAVNIGLKFTDALGMMTKGNYYKGLELALPNGVANVMRGMRFANEGITMRNGDLVLKPEDVSLIDAAFQAVGLPTATITDRQYTQKVVVAFDKFYSERAADIKRSYVEGSRDSDSAAMAEAREDWQKLQESRVKNGYKRQSMSELFRAPAEARKRERGVVGGVETTKSNRRFVEQVSSVS